MCPPISILGLIVLALGDGIVSSEFIFETAPFPSCHASTIAEGSAGLVAAWFGGLEEKAKDVGIWVSRRVEENWTPPVEVANGAQPDGTRWPCWNPVLFAVSDDRLILFYKVGPDPTSWWGMRKTSSDGGKSWSPAERLPDGILGPVKNKPVMLPDGSILAASSVETASDHWRIHFERSENGGKDWVRTPDVSAEPAINAIQPSILQLGDQRLAAIGRTQSGRIFQVQSADLGRTWGLMTLTALPNPSSGTDAVTLRDGRHALVYNHTNDGRSPLNLALSTDGVTWNAGLVLENGPGEYSYPAVIQTKDGKLHVTYTWKRTRIKHVVVDPAGLRPRPIVDGIWPK